MQGRKRLVVEHPNQRWRYIKCPAEHLIKDKDLLEKTFGYTNMGIDSCIYVLANEEFSCSETKRFLEPNMYKGLVNYEIEIYQRYYSENYCRGHWPTIAKCLMELLADPHVQTVYYIPDNINPDESFAFTQESLFKLTAFYIEDNKLCKSSLKRN